MRDTNQGKLKEINGLNCWCHPRPCMTMHDHFTIATTAARFRDLSSFQWYHFFLLEPKQF